MSKHDSHHARTRAHEERGGRKTLCISHLSGFCSNAKIKASLLEAVDALAAPRSMVMSQQVQPRGATSGLLHGCENEKFELHKKMSPLLFS